MWSASSITLTSTSPRWQWPCSMRSISSARTGNDDIGAGLQGGHLAALRGAAEDCDHAQAHGPGQRQENGLDLVGKLAVGTSTRPRGRQAMVGPGQRRDQRDGERNRFA